MKIENDKWVEIHYTLKNDAGEQLDSSVGNDPLGYVHGRGYLIAGLESLLEGHEPGDKFSAHIEPKDGYGEYDEKLIVELTRDKFEFDGEIQVGMPFQVMTPSGLSIVHVTKVEGDKITISISLGKKPTTGQKNALKKAESYSSLMHMSKKGIYGILM